MDVFFGFSYGDDQDEQMISLIAEYKRQRASGVPIDLVRHISTTKLGRDFLIPTARQIEPDKEYSAAELGALTGSSPRVVASRLAILSKTEGRRGGQIFRRSGQRPDKTYSMSAEMKAMLLGAEVG